MGRIADIQILENALRMIADGRRIFRSDTFGDEAFWGDHDGRFKTLLDVVNHYDIHFILGLTDGEKSDLVEYLKSL